MANAPKEALPTQQFVDASAVKDGVLILKNGALRQILLVSGLNFDLKGEDEQNAITFAYQNFLNSLNFSIQIFIHSRRVNIDGYLESLTKIEAQETNPLLRTQVAEYREFIRSFTNENAIMDKSFFVVVPFDPISVPGAAAAGGLLSGLLGRQKKTDAVAAQELEQRFAQNAGQLAQRTEQIVAGLTQIGLRAVPLKDAEIVDLLYNLYNPESIEKKGVSITTATQKK